MMLASCNRIKKWGAHVGVFFCMLMLLPSALFARESVHMVGSSTVYPFVTIAAEEFGIVSAHRTPIVESTGTGGGFKLFCSGVGKDTPDMVNASRAIKSSEREVCRQNGVHQISELMIGYDGIVLANANAAPQYRLNTMQLFMALAAKVPFNGILVDNPYRSWQDVHASLPDVPIEVLGPPPTSGTRDAFVALVMQAACMDLPAFMATYPEKKKRKKACGRMREDGHFIEAGENDNLIVQKLVANPNALGIFGYSFLEENGDKVQGSLINGIAPSADMIAAGSYPIARPLFVYLKPQNMAHVPGLRDFAHFLLTEDMIGREGALVFRGMVPLSAQDYTDVQAVSTSWD